MIKRRIEKLERQYAEKSKFIVVFQHEGEMWIQADGDLRFHGPADEGEKILAQLPANSLIVKMDIPRAWAQ